MGDVEEDVNPFSGRVMHKRLDVRRSESMWEEAAFENHQERTVTGAYVPVEREITTAWLRVPMTQRLARSRSACWNGSNDGLLTWNVLDEAVTRATYPIRRTRD